MEKLKPLTVPLLAVHHYGPEHQKRKAIEEMGELITELEREHDLMVRQLMDIYGSDACLKEYDRKQRRLLRRMDKENGGDYRKEKDDGNKG